MRRMPAAAAARRTTSARGVGLYWTLALIAGAGCVTLSKPAAPIHDYRLDYTPPSVAGGPLPIVLRVSPWGVAAAYDHTPIVYRRDTYAVGAYFYQRWASNPGDMIADLLARDLATSGLYRAVQNGPSVLPADYQLSGFVEEIEEHSAADGCAAHLQVRVLLSRLRVAPADPVLLRTTYTGDVPATCGQALALVRAMSGALERISLQLQEAVHAAIAQDVPRR